jgi:hypothetical protein
MNTIWKTPVEIKDWQAVFVTAGAHPIFVGLDPQGVPSIWWEVNAQAVAAERRIVVVGTGNRVPPGCVHIGSFVDGQYVWHVYAALREV